MLLTGNVFNIERCCLHDGDGVRTVVYLKGCSLSCSWCHNPEGISRQPEIVCQTAKCVLCGNCIKACEHGCHKAEGDSILRSYTNCRQCMKCVEACPTNALTVYGKQMTPQAVFEEISKDIVYYGQTGGGVTISGGECLLQPDFVREILKLCKQNNINTLVESALHVPFENVLKVIPFTDTFYTDIKHMNSVLHKKYTGAGNELIFDNIRKLSELHNNIVIRVPVIPDVNDGTDNLLQTARFAVDSGIERIELLKYNGLASTKYRLLGKKFHDFSAREIDMSSLCLTLNSQIKSEDMFFTAEEKQ